MQDSWANMIGSRIGCVSWRWMWSWIFLLWSFQYCSFRTDGNVFNLRRLQARTKTFAAVIRDLLYAGNCTLLAHSEASRFGLTIILKKTEVLLQPRNRSSYISPSITAGDIKMPVVDKFSYLGSILTSDGKAEEDINSRIAKASSAFCLGITSVTIMASD